MPEDKNNENEQPEEELVEEEPTTVPTDEEEPESTPEPEEAMEAANHKDTPSSDEDIPNPSPEFDETAIDEPEAPEPEQAPEQAITPAQAPVPVSGQEERTWGMLAHLSVLLNLITGFFGGIAALIIYLIYKDRSRFIAYHAMQSLIYQAITWLGAGLVAAVLIGIGTALGILIIPLLCLIPGFLILLVPPASLIYSIIGAVKVNNGEDFRYWQVGDWVRGILEPDKVI